MLGLAQNETDHAQHNPLKPFKIYFEKRRKMKKLTTEEPLGFYAWVSPKRNGSLNNPKKFKR